MQVIRRPATWRNLRTRTHLSQQPWNPAFAGMTGEEDRASVASRARRFWPTRYHQLKCSHSGEQYPCDSLGGLSLLLVLLDALVDVVGELEFVVHVARVGVVGVRADLEVLLVLKLQDLLAPRRAVALVLNLLHHCPDLLLVRIVVLRQQLHELVVGDEVAADHGEYQAAIVAYVLAVVQRVQHVGHHWALAQIFYRHESAPLE